MTKRNFLPLCMLVGLYLFFFCGICSAEQVYPITKTELNMLSNDLSRLETINNQQKLTLREQKSLLKQAKFDLMELQDALKASRQELTKAQGSLQNANQLLQEYKLAEQSRRRRIKAQRNFAYFLFGTALVIAGTL